MNICANCGHEHPSLISLGPPYEIIYETCENDSCQCSEWSRPLERANDWPKEPLRDIIIEAKMTIAAIRKTADAGLNTPTGRRIMRLEAAINRYMAEKGYTPGRKL